MVSYCRHQLSPARLLHRKASTKQGPHLLWKQQQRQQQQLNQTPTLSPTLSTEEMSDDPHHRSPLAEAASSASSTSAAASLCVPAVPPESANSSGSPTSKHRTTAVRDGISGTTSAAAWDVERGGKRPSAATAGMEGGSPPPSSHSASFFSTGTRREGLSAGPAAAGVSRNVVLVDGIPRTDPPAVPSKATTEPKTSHSGGGWGSNSSFVANLDVTMPYVSLPLPTRGEPDDATAAAAASAGGSEEFESDDFIHTPSTASTDSEGAATHRSELQQVLDHFVEAEGCRALGVDDDESVGDDGTTLGRSFSFRLVHDSYDRFADSLDGAADRPEAMTAATTPTPKTNKPPGAILKAKEALEELVVDPDLRAVLVQTIAVALREVHPDQQDVIHSTLSAPFRNEGPDHHWDLVSDGTSELESVNAMGRADFDHETLLDREMHLLEERVLACKVENQKQAHHYLDVSESQSTISSSDDELGGDGDGSATEIGLSPADDCSDVVADVHSSDEQCLDSGTTATPPSTSSSNGVLVGILLLVLLFGLALFLMNVFGIWVAPHYELDVLTDRALEFFHMDDYSLMTPARKKKPMAGIVVVMSETKSRLGIDVAHGLNMLGATIATVMVDCNDLGTVSKSVESIVSQFQKIDFVIHTGNLCLETSPLRQWKSMQEPTSQGHDKLFGGNYLSTFLMTQKLLPYVEQSKHGTIVQFTSPIAANFANGSKLEVADPSSAQIGDGPSASVHRTGTAGFSTLLDFPELYANVKLAESLHMRALTHTYPNIRLMEIPRGWCGTGVAAFFDTIFLRTSQELTPRPSDTADQDLQDDLYRWSQGAVEPWVGGGRKSGRGDSRWPIGWQTMVGYTSDARSTSVGESFWSGQTRTFLVGGAVALAALKINEFAWNGA